MPCALACVQAAAPAASREVVSGLKHLSEEARVRATDKKASKFEKVGGLPGLLTCNSRNTCPPGFSHH